MFETLHYIALLSVLLLAIVLDIIIVPKKIEKFGIKAAFFATGAWVLIALAVCAWIGLSHGNKLASEFLTAYLLEFSLSIDNLFAFIMVFNHFNTPKEAEHRILFWGILSAIVLRCIMIFLGSYFISKFIFIFYIFAILLLFGAYKMLKTQKNQEDDMGDSMMNCLSRIFPLSTKYDGDRFITYTIINKHKKLLFTPMLVVLLVIEKMDLIFAIDSIPAVLTISQDFFIVFFSNILAIIGLRSLYFIVSSFLSKFYLLRFGLAFILTFIAIKMLLMPSGIHIPTLISLLLIFLSVFISIIASIYIKVKKV